MLGFMEDPQDFFAFHVIQCPWLRCRYPLGFHRFGALAMPPVMRSTGTTHSYTRRGDTHHRSQLGDGLIDHFLAPFVCGSALSVASSSNSAESFP